MGHTCVPVTDSPTSSPTTARPTDGPPGLPPLDFDFSDGDAAGDGLSSTFAALVGLAALVLVLIGVVVRREVFKCIPQIVNATGSVTSITYCGNIPQLRVNCRCRARDRSG